MPLACGWLFGMGETMLGDLAAGSVDSLAVRATADPEAQYAVLVVDVDVVHVQAAFAGEIVNAASGAVQISSTQTKQ